MPQRKVQGFYRAQKVVLFLIVLGLLNLLAGGCYVVIVLYIDSLEIIPMLTGSCQPIEAAKRLRPDPRNTSSC